MQDRRCPATVKRRACSQEPRRASTTLPNSTRSPSPVVLTSPPLCAAIVGSISSARIALALGECRPHPPRSVVSSRRHRPPRLRQGGGSRPPLCRRPVRRDHLNDTTTRASHAPPRARAATGGQGRLFDRVHVDSSAPVARTRVPHRTGTAASLIIRQTQPLQTLLREYVPVG